MGTPDTLAIGGPGEMQTPDIAFAAGVFHIVWSDGAMNVVRYRSATLENTTDVSEHSNSRTMQVWPSPTSDDLFVDELHTSTYRLLDPLGKVVLIRSAIGNHIDVSDVAPGGYLLVAMNATGQPLSSARVMIVR